jgi:predicted enzyme related to lactoylglutathione lyase
MARIGKVGMVIHPVKELEPARRFYQEALGLPLKFRDGDRFCTFDAGGVVVALAAGGEDVAGATAVAYRVEDLPAALAALEAAGAVRVRGPEEGAHERRAVLRDPAGNPFILYAPR